MLFHHQMALMWMDRPLHLKSVNQGSRSALIRKAMSIPSWKTVLAIDGVEFYIGSRALDADRVVEKQLMQLIICQGLDLSLLHTGEGYDPQLIPGQVGI